MSKIILWAGIAKNGKAIRIKAIPRKNKNVIKTFLFLKNNNYRKIFDYDTNTWLIYVQNNNKFQLIIELKKNEFTIGHGLEDLFKQKYKKQKASMKITEQIHFKGPFEIRNELINILKVKNPIWESNKTFKRSNFNVNKFIYCFKRIKGGLIIPRGLQKKVEELCSLYNTSIEIEDLKRTLPSINIKFKGKLDNFQNKATENILPYDECTLSAPVGSGKTIMALYVINKRQQPSLIIVHTKELLYQWKRKAIKFLDINPDRIGLIGDGHNFMGDITIGIVDSLEKIAKSIKNKIGLVITDESHRIPSQKFINTLINLDAKYLLGLSATPYRRDGLNNLIWWHTGQLAHTISIKEVQDSGRIVKINPIIRETNCHIDYDVEEDHYPIMISELIKIKDRNKMIANDVENEVRKIKEQGTCLVLSDRKSHCEKLNELIRDKGIISEVLTSDAGSQLREEIVDNVENGNVEVLIATGQLIGEGFDCDRLWSLFLCTPIKFKGRLIQYIGRVLRAGEGKIKANIYDYLDDMSIMYNSLNERKKVYKLFS